MITGTYFRTDSVGNKVVSPKIHEMIRILKALRLINYRLYHDISELHYDKKYGIVLYLRKNAVPIILGFNNYSRKINKLSAIYEILQSQTKLSTLKTIDVRYEGQVVVKNKS